QRRAAAELVGEAGSRGPVVPVGVDDVAREAVLAGDEQLLVREVEHRHLAARAEEGAEVLVAQPEVQRQAIRHLPVVLREDAPLPVLELRAPEATAAITVPGITEQQVCELVAADERFRLRALDAVEVERA